MCICFLFSIFGSVPEDDAEAFNWGYDPVQYNVPEGSYATDPFHGEVRIREMKEMVQALHKAGIGVIMDVVYNHTYNLDSPFQKTVPYYYYREWEDGTISNGSDCGNETASEREMFRRFMVHSVCYWAKEYHIDGFRFDLMALHDTETMNAIRTALNRMPRGEEILVYGEPWKAAASAMQEGYFPSDKQNIGKLMDGISMFCDDTRDSIKGSVFIAAEGGYVNGKERLSAGILSATDGWLDGKGAYEPRNASQLIPYVSAHDNYTLWDKLKLSDPKRKEDAEPDFDKMDERTLSMNRLAAGIVMTCKGMPFFQAGEEFARTKHGEGNSFKSSWQLNKIDWTRALEQEELVNYYRGLLKLRRKFQAYGTCEPDCKKTFFRENQIAGYELEYPDGCAVCVFYNPWEKEALQKLPEGNWKLLCDGKRCAEDGAEMKENFKSGFVTLIGRPNVGKSTLMNHLIGQKIAITSNKPQTTRNRIQTVLTTEEGQIVFVDTPGIHKAKNKLGEYMVNIAERSLNEVDVVLWLVEPSNFIGEGEKHIIEQLKKVKTPVILVINKIDMVKREEILAFIDTYRKEYDFAEIVPVSARTGDNTDELVKVILNYLPYGPQFYDEDTVTDQPERQIVAELIREKALHCLNEEIPHGIAVAIDQMKMNKKVCHIDATIICERDSHKGIIIGKQGSMLKKIGSNARYELERMLEAKVNLKLWVKVTKNWRDSDFLIKNFGYDKKEI